MGGLPAKRVDGRLTSRRPPISAILLCMDAVLILLTVIAVILMAGWIVRIVFPAEQMSAAEKKRREDEASMYQP